MKKIITIIALCLMLLIIPVEAKGSTYFVHSDYSHSYSLIIGEKVKLKTGETDVIKWSSKDKKTATVSKNGEVKAKKTGRTIVTAKTKGKIIEYTISVSKATKAYSISTGSWKGSDHGNKVEYVTKSKYNSISNGQTYDSVVEVMGTGGSLISYQNDDENETQTEVYTWYGEDGISSSSIVFVNGKVTEKAEMFLK